MTFTLGDHVKKKSGSEWEGVIVGTYSTKLTPEGYAVESSAHKGSVQIYPAGALESSQASDVGEVIVFGTSENNASILDGESAPKHQAIIDAAIRLVSDATCDCPEYEELHEALTNGGFLK